MAWEEWWVAIGVGAALLAIYIGFEIVVSAPNTAPAETNLGDDDQVQPRR